jgi:hypothetical protein
MLFIDVSFIILVSFFVVSFFMADESAGAIAGAFMAPLSAAAGFDCDEQAATANTAATRAKRFMETLLGESGVNEGRVAPLHA